MEFDPETGTGAVDADSHGVGGDAEDGPDLCMGEALPGQETQQLLVVTWKMPQRFDGGAGRVTRLRFHCLSRGFMPGEAIEQPPAPRLSAPAVGEHAATDAVEPGPNLVAGGDLGSTSPYDGKRLGDGIFRIGRFVTTPKCIRQDWPAVLLEGTFELGDKCIAAHSLHGRLDADAAASVPPARPALR